MIYDTKKNNPDFLKFDTLTTHRHPYSIFKE